MGELVDLNDKIKKYFKFTPYEIKGLIISVVVFGFIISFKEWGAETFDLGAGFFNWFNATLIVALSFLVHDAGQRIWGLAIGYKVEYKIWSPGIAIALIIAFLSQGNLWLIVPGTFMIHHLAGHRLGYFRYGVNYIAQGLIAFAGPLSSLILIIFLKSLYAFFPTVLLKKAIIFNVIYTITNMLPIPPLDGSKLYFGSRMIYAFMLPAVLAATILLIVDIPIFFALVLSMLIGVVLWIAYYVVYERKAWTGPK